tara:strand:- start:84 stop:305 length:222 start_codon:yes stop_codon:yes gene_type:complete
MWRLSDMAHGELRTITLYDGDCKHLDQGCVELEGIGIRGGIEVLNEQINYVCSRRVHKNCPHYQRMEERIKWD